MAEPKDHNYINAEKGVLSWFMTVDHKRIGIMYLAAMMVFFILGGIAALIIRTELIAKGENFISDDMYNTFFTLHGVIMVFLFIVPGIPATLGNFCLPLMLGARDVIFPKLNRFSFWLYCLGALIAFASVFMGLDTGWTFYAPYSIDSNGLAVVTATLAAFVLGFSSILTGINFLVTIHKMRCPGMTWERMPLFAWSLYAASILQVLATPIIGLTLLFLILENTFGIGIFDSTRGGDSLLFEHMFWFYSHPVVYIMILPAFGIVSEIVPVFSRKPIFGYKAIVWASVGIAAVSFLVWGHHMFVAGMSDTMRYVFSALTFLVAIPTAIKVFNWVATMYKGEISLESPMLYAIGFIFLFMIAGTTGIHLATLATDAHYHDTYFVVAHFHYTMQGGTVIALFMGLHYWWPIISGRTYNEAIAKLGWLLFFIGFNGTFIPQFILGMKGMPRRYYDYPPEFENLHAISSLFSYLNALAYIFIMGNLIWSFFKGKAAKKNPWSSLSLEWEADLPPHPHNFRNIPEIVDWTYSYGKDSGNEDGTR